MLVNDSGVSSYTNSDVARAELGELSVPQRAAVLTPMLETLVGEWPRDLLVIKALSEHHLRLAQQTMDDQRRAHARQAQVFAARAVELYPTHLPLRQTLIRAAQMTGDDQTVAAQQAEISRLEPLVHRDNRSPQGPQSRGDVQRQDAFSPPVFCANSSCLSWRLGVGGR